MSKTIASQFQAWQPPAEFLCIKTLDCHTGGEPLRIITDGFPALQGDTVLAQRRYCMQHYDNLRTALMFEPRGHADMYGVLITKSERPDSHFGAIFIHNQGYSTMCGHAIIALAKFAVESGIVPATHNDTQVRIDAPCGLIIAQAKSNDRGEIVETSFDCVASFVVEQDAIVNVPGLGDIRFDLAYGGAYYAYVNVEDVGLKCDTAHYAELIRIGRAIKKAVAQQFQTCHPYVADLSFLYGTIFTEALDDPELHSRNVCIFADGEVDRSPTGSGVSGRAAIHFARGDIALQQSINISSILGSRFKVEVRSEVEYGPYGAVIPRVTGTAHISAKCEFIIDPQDPLEQGFIFR